MEPKSARPPCKSCAVLHPKSFQSSGVYWGLRWGFQRIAGTQAKLKALKLVVGEEGRVVS